MSILLYCKKRFEMHRTVKRKKHTDWCHCACYFDFSLYRSIYPAGGGMMGGMSMGSADTEVTNPDE